MNDLQAELLRLVDVVVACCATDVGDGRMSVTAADVLGKSRAENVVMTRCILCRQLYDAGYSVTTISQLLKRTQQAVRHLLDMDLQYHRQSRAYRIAEAEATQEQYMSWQPQSDAIRTQSSLPSTACSPPSAT